MQLKNIALVAAAALSSTVTADFVVLSVPTPTNLAVLTNLPAFISSVQNYVTAHIASLTASAPSSAISAALSAQTALASFAATATYSIPSDVTKLGAVATFTTVPAWYSALPSDLKSYYDKNNAQVQSLLNEAVGNTPAAGTTGGQASKTGTATGAAKTGGAVAQKTVGMVGAGVAAAFVGVLAL